MSEYLYCFKPTPKEISGLYVFQLTFRRGNAQDTADIDRICKRVEDQWEKKAEAFPTYYIVGKLAVGTFVYQITKDILDPHWFDCGPMPGKPRVIGSLKREGGGWVIHPYFAVERRQHKLSGGMLHLKKDDPSWMVTGLGGLDFATAKVECDKLYRAELDSRTDDATHGYSFEVVPG